MKRNHIGMRRSPLCVYRIPGEKPANKDVGVGVIAIDGDNGSGFCAMGCRRARLLRGGVRHQRWGGEPKAKPISSSHLVVIVTVSLPICTAVFSGKYQENARRMKTFVCRRG